ncbi:MAG: ankyrin repeat domain-containing protein [Rhodocyclaceae bacterium]|nr:ankyrin repeat domain-containing protein [Rhodocyclaceae bacterium]MBK6553073.1 ankyrin repeat domain-containing protein [Rhodocyclaceae bacterium]MBK6675982.1 ankyrin repeat domain-containing protein [Rhodocyclaceae bacterium]MBK9311394.1 ankyrin repeat domain-containing protein [Rhodocyclaceae bacterium]MBK9956450.1 ankyrin repeat domain-containing protein [Rhodocyclaceae bacterium]
MRKPLILLAVVSGLGFGIARAALPDPVAFGVAVELGKVEAARGWLDEGLPPDTEADRIGTGLMIGAWEGNIPMMELFLSRGADIHHVNRHGEQALQLAAWRGQIEAVRWLLDHGASASRAGKAWSALHYAVFAGHEDIARLLMARGADINARAPNDATVLMMAAREGREPLARALVEAGADTRLKNDRGDTAFSLAMRNGNLRIASLVSPREEFAEAVKAPPERYPPQRKSVPAPSEITRLLKKLREAEAAGQPTEAARQVLMDAIDKFRKEARPFDKLGAFNPKVSRGKALMITASRSGSGERAEVVATTPARMAWNYEESRLADLTELMRRLDEAEKAGRPKAELAKLRREVQEAYRRMKGD